MRQQAAPAGAGRAPAGRRRPPSAAAPRRAGSAAPVRPRPAGRRGGRLRSSRSRRKRAVFGLHSCGRRSAATCSISRRSSRPAARACRVGLPTASSVPQHRPTSGCAAVEHRREAPPRRLARIRMSGSSPGRQHGKAQAAARAAAAAAPVAARAAAARWPAASPSKHRIGSGASRHSSLQLLLGQRGAERRHRVGEPGAVQRDDVHVAFGDDHRRPAVASPADGARRGPAVEDPALLEQRRLRAS